jgi:TfoX/Sxy family transcriptional regulator of competence genes
MWKKRSTYQDTTMSAAVSNSNLYIGSQERLMSYNVKADVAECYRRAEEYKKLYYSASNLDEREMYLSTVRQFLRLAKDLEKG